MSFIKNIDLFNKISDEIKKLVFGPKNENLDELLDRFYSIRQEKRARIIAYAVISYFALIFIIICFYFYSLNNLQKRLNSSVSYINQIANIYGEYTSTESDYSALIKDLQTSSSSTDALANALSEKAKDMGIDIQNIPPNIPDMDLPLSSPLAKSLHITHIDVKLNSVSIKKMMDYIEAIQTMPQKFRVTSLEVKQTFDTKLYFNVSLVVEAYLPIAKGQE